MSIGYVSQVFNNDLDLSCDTVFCSSCKSYEYFTTITLNLNLNFIKWQWLLNKTMLLTNSSGQKETLIWKCWAYFMIHTCLLFIHHWMYLVACLMFRVGLYLLFCLAKGDTSWHSVMLFCLTDFDGMVTKPVWMF